MKIIKPRVNWYMWKWFSWLNPEDVHDIMQDTWGKLMENISVVGVMSQQEQFNWLVKVCHNQAVSFLRKQDKMIDQDSETMERLLEARRVISLEDEVMDRIMLEELIQKLSKEDRKILYSSEFCSEKKKKNQTNAETCKIYRVKQKLRKLWKEGDWDV